jgi:hypothetical protein
MRLRGNIFFNYGLKSSLYPHGRYMWPNSGGQKSFWRLGPLAKATRLPKLFSTWHSNINPSPSCPRSSALLHLFRSSALRTLSLQALLALILLGSGNCRAGAAGQPAGGVGVQLLTDKWCIPLRSASVWTPHLFHHGIRKVLVNPRSMGITSVRSTFIL